MGPYLRTTGWLLVVLMLPLSAAAQVRSNAYRPVLPAGWLVRKDVDPQDTKVRFLLLAPGGPVLIEAQLTVDGQPYQALLERQLDTAIKAADILADNQIEWATEGEQFRLPGRSLLVRGAPQGQMGMAFDLDKDGKASRYELRRMVCVMTGGPPLVVGQSYAGPLSWETCFQQLADQDRDGTISKAELESLPHRLHLRDANDNELVEPYELLEGRAAAYLTRIPARAALVQLAEETDWENLAKELGMKYPPKYSVLGNGEPRLGELTRELDASGDGRLDAAELRKLLAAEPHVRVEANMGAADPKPSGAFITSVSDALRESARLSAEPANSNSLSDDQRTDKRHFKLEIPGVRLAVNGQSPVGRNDQSQIQARNYMLQFDKDQNGYLDETEQKTPSIARLVASWDQDGNGKVYLGEIQTALAENSRLENNRVSVNLMDEPKELFKFVDVDQDGRLGPRELTGVRERLLLLDGNRSGELEPEEFPGLLRITFFRGQSLNVAVMNRMNRMVVGRKAIGQPPAKSWFSDMDVNGDRELSTREFLGTPEQFAALDADRDQLLTETEAEYAK